MTLYEFLLKEGIALGPGHAKCMVYLGYFTVNKELVTDPFLLLKEGDYVARR